MNCSVELVSPSIPYGPVAAGLLTVSARPIEELLDRNESILVQQTKKNPNIKRLFAEGLPDAIETDLPENSDGTTPVNCLEMATLYRLDDESKLWKVPSGLILVPVGSSTYRRVSWFNDGPCSMSFEDCSYQEITII